jgi:hypothetical protein
LDSFVKNSGYFVKLLKSVNLQSLGTLVSSDVASVFTAVPTEEALKIVRNKLNNLETPAGRSVSQAKDIMELLELWLRTSYFEIHDELFQRKNSIAMESSVSPIARNVYMEHFEKRDLDLAEHRQSLCIRYVDDIFAVWSHGAEPPK